MNTTSRMILLLAWLTAVTAQAKDVGAVYIKNSGKDIMHLWVNGTYQGYLRPGETRYTVSDGFITNDSDRPTSSGGRTATKESHGGWENSKSGPVELTFQYPGDQRQTNQFSADGGKDLVVGVNESTSKTSPEPPTEIEVEGAPAIIKGTLPDLKRTTNQKTEKGQIDPVDRFAGQYILSYAWEPADKTFKATASAEISTTGKLSGRSLTPVMFGGRYESNYSAQLDFGKARYESEANNNIRVFVPAQGFADEKGVKSTRNPIESVQFLINRTDGTVILFEPSNSSVQFKKKR